VSAKAVFVAGAHTDAGKTHVACALIGALRRQGVATDALKPVVSGFDPDDWAQSDPGRLLTALGRTHTPEALALMSPLRFRAPLAPPMAARREGQSLRLEPIVAACGAALARSQAEALLIEGVGGLMSPLADGATGLDLMIALDAPTILVGGSYLGAVSHLLTAAEVLANRGLPLLAVVASESAGPDAPDFDETVEMIGAHLPGAAIFAARRGDESWTAALSRHLIKVLEISSAAPEPGVA
jgi:dethiobiotin synthetase